MKALLIVGGGSEVEMITRAMVARMEGLNAVHVLTPMEQVSQFRWLSPDCEGSPSEEIERALALQLAEQRERVITLRQPSYDPYVGRMPKDISHKPFYHFLPRRTRNKRR